jgi:hypothetical protein
VLVEQQQIQAHGTIQEHRVPIRYSIPLLLLGAVRQLQTEQVALVVLVEAPLLLVVQHLAALELLLKGLMEQDAPAKMPTAVAVVALVATAPQAATAERVFHLL